MTEEQKYSKEQVVQFAKEYARLKIDAENALSKKDVDGYHLANTLIREGILPFKRDTPKEIYESLDIFGLERKLFEHQRAFLRRKS